MKSEQKKSENQKKAKKKRGKRGGVASFFGTLLALVLVAALASAAFCAFSVRDLLKPVDTEGKSEYVTIPQGMSVREIGELLEEKALIQSSKVFYYVARFPQVLLRRNPPLVFQSGVYEISPAMDTLEIIGILADGKQAFIKTSIPEGLTIGKIAKILDRMEVCGEQEFIRATRDEEMLKALGIDAENCEGYLFPDTYFFYPNMTAEEVVAKMIDNFFLNLNKIEGQEKAKSIDYGTLVLASIVEREFRVDEEAPLIAGVFKNRLEVGMRLESCATVEYIITEIQKKAHPEVITYKDLWIQSPFNTYRNEGLPPRPICNPGRTALAAALNPEESGYLYFTLTDAHEGRHTFSETLDEHTKATTEFRTKRAN